MSAKTPNILKIAISKRQWLNRIDNRSYSTIYSTTFTTYNMKIEVRPAILEFFDFLSQKLIWIPNQNSHQTCKEVEMSPLDQI